MGRRATVLVVALVLAGIAAFSIFQFLRGIEAEAEAGQEQIPVFRAIAAIPEGTQGNNVLQAEGVSFEESTEEQADLPGNAITSREELESTLSGKVTAGPISANQVLTSDQWVELTVDITPLSELIGEGKQAITIAPGQVQGVNGFVRPGDRINAIITLDIALNLTAVGQPSFGVAGAQTGEGGDTQTVRYTRYVLQGLPVLAVSRDVRPKEGEPEPVAAVQPDPTSPEGQAAAAAPEGEASTVFTLEVTPEQAERIVFAQDAGSLYFTLVPEDFVEAPTAGVTIETLFAGNLAQDIFATGN